MASMKMLRKAFEKWSPSTSNNNINIDGGSSNIKGDSDLYFPGKPTLSHSNTFNSYSPNEEPPRRSFRFLTTTNRLKPRIHNDAIRDQEISVLGKTELKELEREEFRLERARSKKETKLERERSKLERARSKKETKLERERSKKENKLRTRRPRPQHMDTMESFSWNSESVSGSGSAGGYGEGLDWDDHSDVSPHNTRNNSRVKDVPEGEHEVQVMRRKSIGYYRTQAGQLHSYDQVYDQVYDQQAYDQQVAEMRRLML